MWSLIAFLFSQWTMASHLCLPDIPLTAADSHSTSATHKGCGGDQHGKTPTHTAPCDDARCALHCAQPDEISSWAKWPLPDAVVADRFSVSTWLVIHRLEPSQPVPDHAPVPDARRRLIELGALLI